MIKMKHFGAAAASSGGVEMYSSSGTKHPRHAVGRGCFLRPCEDGDVALRGGKHRKAYEDLFTAKDSAVDFVMLGCPHNSIEQMSRVARALDGRKVGRVERAVGVHAAGHQGCVGPQRLY